MPVTSNTVVWLPEDHVLKAKWSGVSGRFTLDTREMRVTFVSDWGEVSPASKDVTVGEAYGALPEFDEREH